VSGLELVCQLQGVQAHIRSQDAAMGDSQKIGELSSPTTNFNDASIERNLLVEQAREGASARFLNKRTHVVHVVVVWEWGLLVKLFDQIRNAATLQLGVIRWQKKPRNILFDRISS